MYKAFATPEQTQAFRQQLIEGMAWGEAKDALHQLLEAMIAPMRDRYEALMARPQDIEDLLQVGARKARAYATPFIHELKAAVGLRDPLSVTAVKTESKARKARFVNFRDEDGTFRFRLQDAAGQALFLSRSYADPKQAGVAIKALQTAAFDEVVRQEGSELQIHCAGEEVARVSVDQRDAVHAALDSMRD